MALKANELIILSYINKFKKIDYIEIQKEINEPLLQLSNVIYDLYIRKYFYLTEDGRGADVTDLAKREPIYVWNDWGKDEQLEYDGNKKYVGKVNQFGLPNIETVDELYELLSLKGVKRDAYREFEICNEEKIRRILAPSKKLKERQKWILRNVLSKIELKDCVHGFVKGKSIVTNAKCHVQKKEILCLDIADFFPSIKIREVVEVFKQLGYNKEVAEELGDLCTFDGVLPQGAPTSPALSNIIFTIVDEQLISYSKRNNLVYTRYADDITFSTNVGEIEKHAEPIINIISEYGYSINVDKTHIMKDNYRKMVTGLVINESVKVPKKFKKKFKQEIYYCKKYGISQHLHAIGRDSAVNFREYMYGKAYFIKMVEKELGEYYLGQLDELFSASYV